MKRNPTHYKLNPSSSSPETILQGIYIQTMLRFDFLLTSLVFYQEICVKDLQLLEENRLIQKSTGYTLKATRM
jgi:hypothetical protein